MTALTELVAKWRGHAQRPFRCDPLRVAVSETLFICADQLEAALAAAPPAPALLTPDDVATLTRALQDGSTRAVCVALDEVLYTKGDNDPTGFHGAVRWLLASDARLRGQG